MEGLEAASLLKPLAPGSSLSYCMGWVVLSASLASVGGVLDST